jgi:hypothetical protein
VHSLGGGATVHGDQINQSGKYATGKTVYASQPTRDPSRHTVLLLMSNPTGTQQLRLDEEYRAIDQAIASARHRDRIQLHLGSAPRHRDLHDLLLRHRPALVHYAGHHNARGIALVDDYGGARAVAPDVLEELFAILGDTVRCVVLNACLSREQAAAIGKHVPCVVGMAGSVVDTVAIVFAEAFHRGLANGESVAQAFRLGRNQLKLVGMDSRDPVLFGHAERVFLTDGPG